MAADLLFNGDFELPNYPQLNNVGVGNPSILGWTVTEGTVDLSGGVNTLYGWATYTGNHSLDLNGVNAGTIQQSVTTVPGASYTLSFALAGNPFQSPSNGPPIKVLNMSILDTSVPGVVTVIQSQQFKFDVSDSTVLSMNYKLKSQPVVAFGKNTTIRFASDSQVGNGGPCLDSVTFCQGTDPPNPNSFNTCPGPPAPPPPAALSSASSSSSNSPSRTEIAAIVGGVGGGILVAVCVLSLLLFCFWQRRLKAIPKSFDEENPTPAFSGAQSYKSWGPGPLSPSGGPYSLATLRAATADFSEESVIGRGSFGVVHVALLPDGTTVAVKRLEKLPGRHDFEDRAWRAEVEALGNVRHRNLVPLLGVCTEEGQSLLVFEYFTLGSLGENLHKVKPDAPPLSWAERLSIARDVARGLAYLHNDIRPPMLHRDIKSANILLIDREGGLQACIADFGLAHLVLDAGANTSTMVKGTVPYMAPEYLHGGPQYLTPKCDVYSFGILLLELVSGRMVVQHHPDGSVEVLSEVAAELYKQDRELELLDPALRGEFDAQEAMLCIRVALACTQRRPSARPDMAQVGLQLAKNEWDGSISLSDGSTGSGSFVTTGGRAGSGLGSGSLPGDMSKDPIPWLVASQSLTASM
ncbi:Protein kinase superfamily protein [Klebsormidium nitens]|uniref:Protein kinase superfamily protein n=1 Tax=Klebsormidium nitens TaxID=105231 RepID=A0A1Y1IJP2_KLENI|nr:Protein kinase superfamily protein [Klebsormidium nitens]|eukprot:GAQ89341.1 Protein kinase superfamily protein [Klebsormidium nitens]